MIPTGPLIRRRIAISMAIFLSAFMALGTRLFYLQVVRAEQLQLRATRQWTSEAVIQPQRGAILDRNGDTLALSATAYTASVSPRQVKNLTAFAQTLAPILNMEPSEISKRAGDTSKGGVTLKRQLTRETAQQLRLMMAEMSSSGVTTLNGLYLEQDMRRVYPNGAFLTQLLGLTTIDGVGQAGLEASLNRYLSGQTGRVVTEIDGKGRELDSSAAEYVKALDGATVYLTIDDAIQGFAEKAAREAMEVNGAEGVRILVMNPKTGEILALVSKPDYDPNNPPRSDVEALNALMRNKIVSDAYEPGSTFKILTMSAALQEGLTNLREHFYCSGSVYVEGGRIRCWGRPHGSESLTQALENSCNPVFVELGLRLGISTFYDYLEAFGLGEKTGVDIAGEAGGILISRGAVKRVDIARIGFGQSVAVTPIQLLTAACAVVNGGNLLTPYVVKEIVDANGDTIERGQTLVRGTPITKATSDTMRGMLQSVVTNGGGRNAYIEGYRVGGKTGTAQVYDDGAVSTSAHIGSFIGFAPMDDPQIAVLVIVDRADRSPDYGSVTAAPFARDILSQSLVYLGVERESVKQTLATVTVPDLTGETLASAAKILKAHGLSYVLNGVGNSVIDQLPAPGALMNEKSIVMLYMDGNAQTASDAYVSVPDVAGLSVMDANRALASYGLMLEIEGGGLAQSQTPEAGQLVFPTTRVRVRFEMPE